MYNDSESDVLFERRQVTDELNDENEELLPESDVFNDVIYIGDDSKSNLEFNHTVEFEFSEQLS